MLFPGGGVGGHCIPKDSWLLATPLGEGAEASLLGVARRINDHMPAHVARLVTELIGGPGPRVAILGFSYLQNSDDTRNSPSLELAAALEELGYSVAVHDPFVDAHKGDVMDVAIVESAGAILDGAVLEAVAGWKFSPATVSGTAVSMRLTLQHLFRR